MMRFTSLILFLTATPLVIGVSVNERQMHLQTVNPKKNCHLNRPRAAMLQKVNSTVTGKIPGTGMNKSTTASDLSKAVIYMDGFSMIGCIKDDMFYHGDKHGDNKYSYELADSSQVSITIYSDIVPKEDQLAMTPDVCFDFCRVQKDMFFFGITNGHTCYCAPYVKAMAGDDAVCDVVCEGDAGAICGSKDKSSAFEMHSCDDTGAQLTAELSAFKAVLGKVKTEAGLLKKSAAFMITESNTLQEKFGKVGDPVVGDLFQVAVAESSDAQNLAATGLALEAAQAGLISQAESLAPQDFSSFATANAADEAIEEIAKGKAAAEKYLTSLNGTASDYMPFLLASAPDSKDAAAQYYPIMYFIDKDYNTTTATCGGDLADLDMGLTKDECAKKCDDVDSAQKPACVGFLYVPGASQADLSTLPDSYCFMFAKFTSVQYYTGCASGFLQGRRADKGTMCYGKLSKFSGGAPVLDKEKGQKAKEATQRCVPEV